jgi:hypothetical protein
MKVIQPLFLDDLRTEFERLRARRDTGRTNALNVFHEGFASLKFFDPACGCGIFFIIAYRELRALEIELLKEIYPQGQRVLDVASLSKINVNQFYGIELSEFPARITETALWMMEHIMNNRLSLEFGEAYARIPLKVSPHIYNADALEIDWADVLPPEDCSFVYGNPPFVGQSYQTPIQRQQMARLVGRGRGGSLDYVCAWFLKAGAYVRALKAPIAFVATNSITQGEQVAQLWPLLFHRCGLEIAFAHRTFAWGSDAPGVAHVHVVILGLTIKDLEPKEKRLFSYANLRADPEETTHAALSPYLFDASQLSNHHLVIEDRRAPFSSAVKPMRMRSKIVDNGIYILTDDERVEFLRKEQRASGLAQAVLDARATHQNATLADLYDPDVMPADLRKAHHALDLAVDKLYRPAPFSSDRERVEHLFGLYEKLVAPLSAIAAAKTKAKPTTRRGI